MSERIMGNGKISLHYQYVENNSNIILYPHSISAPLAGGLWIKLNPKVKMNTSQFIEEYAKRIGVSKELAAKHLKCFLGLVIEGTRNNNVVSLGGYGRFYRYTRARDGEILFKFAASSELKNTYWEQWEEQTTNATT